MTDTKYGGLTVAELRARLVPLLKRTQGYGWPHILDDAARADPTLLADVDALLSAVEGKGRETCDAGAIQRMEARKDAAYLERNQVVAALAAVFPSGTARTAIPGWSDDWHGCVYIDLPTGQASWHYHDSHAHLFAHLPPYAGKWDGHTTEEKYARLTALASPSTEGWRGMESAPRDGTDILLRFKRQRCAIAWGNHSDLIWADSSDDGELPDPVAWMPLLIPEQEGHADEHPEPKASTS